MLYSQGSVTQIGPCLGEAGRNWAGIGVPGRTGCRVCAEHRAGEVLPGGQAPALTALPGAFQSPEGGQGQEAVLAGRARDLEGAPSRAELVLDEPP